jgi:hypothetical protein
VCRLRCILTGGALRVYVPHSVVIETLVSHISGIYTLQKTSICIMALKNWLVGVIWTLRRLFCTKVWIKWGDTIPLCYSVTSNRVHTNTTHKLFYSLLHGSVIHFEHHQLRDEHISMCWWYTFSIWRLLRSTSARQILSFPAHCKHMLKVTTTATLTVRVTGIPKGRLAPSKQIYNRLLIVHIRYSYMGKNRYHTIEFYNH